ncbi:MAG: hypothetical protein QXF26_06725, partial [Candidatus Bathyarchaeia archaeon]
MKTETRKVAVDARKLVAISVLFMFAFGIIGGVVPAYATVSGSLVLVRPDKVAPGGPIELDASALTATGGTVYFYLSLDDDPIISSGDLYFASVKTSDLDDSVTVFVPSTLGVGKYYVKAVDLKQVGRDAVVTGDKVEVPETFPVVTIDPTAGKVGKMPEIKGEEAEDYADVTIAWKEYGKYEVDYPGIISDGEFTVEDYAIPHAFEGTYSLIILLTSDEGDTFATKVSFSVVPDVSVVLPATWSILAEELDQEITIHGTGFPKGEVAKNTIRIIVKDFLTGTTKDTYETSHDKVEVSDTDPTEGDLDVDIMVDYVEIGSATIEINVDGKTRAFSDKFFVSDPTAVADFTSIKYAKVSASSGKIDDEVTFSFINLPADADVVVRWMGSTVSTDVAAGTADDFGAFKYKWKLADLPGETYTVRAIVTADGVTREKNIGAFTVLPTFEIWKATEDEVLSSAKVSDPLRLRGTGFPADATIETVYFGTKEVDFDNVETGSTGTFLIDEIEPGKALVVPHISGGGKSVPVTIYGKDAEGKTIKAESSLVVKPKLIADDEGDWDVGVLNTDGEWEAYDVATVFPGNPVKLVGYGFLAGESVSVKLYDADDVLVGAATVTSGGTAKSNGDLEVVCWLPVVKALYPGGKEGVYLTVAGATSSNKANSVEFDVAPSSDASAKLFFGLKDDGKLDLKMKVGEVANIMGVGFRTRSLKLVIDEIDKEVKEVTTSNGYFFTSITIPAMEGHVDGREYTLKAGDTAAEAVFKVYPEIMATPNKGFPGDTFTVSGTGFEDGSDVAIIWIGVAEKQELDTVDGDDVEDGSFSISLTVPNAVAQSYRIEADVADVEWASTTFQILDV